MKLLDNPIDRQEIDEIIRMINGNINRICVSKDKVEIIRCLGFAIDDLSLIAYSKMLERERQMKKSV